VHVRPRVRAATEEQDVVAGTAVVTDTVVVGVVAGLLHLVHRGGRVPRSRVRAERVDLRALRQDRGWLDGRGELATLVTTVGLPDARLVERQIDGVPHMDVVERWSQEVHGDIPRPVTLIGVEPTS